MKVPKNIPAQDVDVDISQIVINPKDRSAKLIIRYDGQRQEKNVNLMTIYNQGNATQKQTIRQFIRGIVAVGLGVSLSDVPDDIFN